MKRFLPFFVLCCWVPPLFAAPQSIELATDFDSLSLGAESYYFILDRFLPGELKQETLSQFQRTGQRMPNFGISKDQVWFWNRLANTGKLPLKLILTVGANNLHCRVYLLDPGQLPQKGQELAIWNPENFQLLYQIHLPPQSRKELFQNCYSNIYLGFRNILSSPQKYWEQQILETSIKAFYYGALFSIWLYNLFLFLSLKERGYLYYLFCLLAYAGVMTGIDGTANQYWIGVESGLWYAMSFSALSGTAFGFFTRELLRTKQHIPKWDKVIQGMMLYLLVLGLSAFFLPNSVLEAHSPVSGFIMPGILLTAGFLTLKRHPRVAKLYLAAWGAYLIGFVVYVAVYLGWIGTPYSLMELTYLGKLSSLTEISLLALALADRIQALKREKKQAQIKLVHTLQNHAADLEEQVNLRTSELRMANEAKNKFFSIISHDLRGPVGSLSVLFNVVLEKGSELEGALFEGVKHTTKNIHRLLEDLLVWAKSQQGEIEVHPLDYPLAISIEQSMELVSAQLTQKQISVQSFCQKDVKVLADPALITTIIRNFLGNAIKFTPEGGEIQIDCRSQGDMVEVSVIDNGCGIPQEIQKRLFKIGEKISSGLSANGEGGSGLGLILCSEFVAKSGGKIGVESEPGQGSRFWFTLPKSQANGEQEVWRRSLAGMKVLLVEDERIHAASSAQVLRNLKMEYELASDGAQALMQIKAKPFDLVLMDIDMPVMDGAQASMKIQSLKQKPKWVIALSAYSEKDLQQRFTHLAFEGSLNKPLVEERLIALLKQLAENQVPPPQT